MADWRKPTHGNRRNITVHNHVPHDFSIQTDREYIERIISIVFDNALEFSADGGDVDLEVSQNGGKTKITVRDTGCGIDDEDLENIFTPFVLEPEKCRPMGFGLNLPLARIMVKALDGRIWAESEGKGRGAVFTSIFSPDNTSSFPYLQLNR